MKLKGYRYRDKIIWLKVTKNGVPVNGNGWVVRHSIETLLIFSKGKVGKMMNYHRANHIIKAQVMRGSQKPEAVIDEIMRVAPNRHFLQTHSRSNNLRANMVCVGNQVKGTSFMDEVFEHKGKNNNMLQMILSEQEKLARLIQQWIDEM
jgi:N6-adenosine-specific RNA methylase IME4